MIHNRRAGGGRRVSDVLVGTVADQLTITNGAIPGMVTGQTVQLTWRITNSRTGNDVAGTVTFATSNAGIATVDSAGLVTAAAGSGTATITGTLVGPNITSTVSVTVQAAQVPDAVTISTAPIALVAGQTTGISATVDQAGVPLTGRTVAWSSDTPSVATVGADSAALDPVHSSVVTSVAAGSAIITATSGALTDTLAVTVTAAPTPPADFSNQPTGGNPWTLVSDVTFDTSGKIPTSTALNLSTMWSRDSASSAAKTTLVDASTIVGLAAAPFGDNVMACSYSPCGLGTGPFIIRQSFSSGEVTYYRELYWVIWFAYHPSFYDGDGAVSMFKFGFLKGALGSSKLGHWWGEDQHNVPTTHRIATQHGTAGPGGQDYGFNGSPHSPRGTWIKQEQHIIAGAAGVNDGLWKVWLNGTLKKTQVAITTLNGETPGFRAMSYNPTYSQTGAAQGQPPATAIPAGDPRMVCYIARWATFGRN